MKDLRGSELNPTPLLEEDFEREVITPFYKVQIYKNGWQDVDGVTGITIDFQGSAADGVVSSSLNLNVNDNEAKYHPLSGSPYSDYFSFRRKIRVLIGIEKDDTPYTWSYFTGYINTMQHRKVAGSNSLQRAVTVRALDYCDVLNTYNFDKNIYWGSTVTITLLPNTYEYDMPAGCKGIHRVTKDEEEFTDWTYNWETNKFVITKEEEGTLKVYYHTSQNVVTVLQSILNMAGITQTLIYTPTDKTIDRVYFNEGTSALEAVKNLSQLVNYRFWFDGDGIPHFESMPEVGTTDFTFKDYKNLQAETISIEDKEFYNAVEVFGEDRTRKLYYKEEIQLGDTIESFLDATTESRTHSFTFYGYGKLRYDLSCENKNGLTSELNETPTGADITLTHNPAQSREAEQTHLGYVTGSLFYALSGGNVINTDTTQFLDHVAATRIKAVILDEYGTQTYNKYGMQVSVTPESYWRTQLYLSHDPLRNLSETVQTIGSKTSYASPTGITIVVPFTSGKLWGNVKWETDYETGWGPEIKTGPSSFSLSSSQLCRKVTMYLSQNYQGEMRWEGDSPSDLPLGPFAQCAQRITLLPANTYRWVSATGLSTLVELQGAYEVADERISVLDTQWAGSTFSVLFYNPTSSSSYVTVTVYGRLPAVIHSIEYAGNTDSSASFYIRRTASRGTSATFKITVWSKRKPYNVKVTNTKLTGTSAEFLAKCDFDSPTVSIICKGQEPTPRQYRVDVLGCKLIPRRYFLKLFGREEVSELTSSIYSQKTLSPDEIQETGGKKTLTIRNHLIQSQDEAETIAQNLLNHYRQIINSFIIEVSCPPPLEVGDTVSIVSQY